ncbi:non-canonical purine NTP pyrophosphatase [bacterium]|nr:non-canonical purine NTP pyrophosphatase [bacterium]
MSRTIIYATGNASKIEMMKNLFPHDEVLSLKDIHFDREIVENGTTFQENAMIKAQAVQDFLKAQGKEYSVIGDDSGFCVDALGGKPGLASARYA